MIKLIPLLEQEQEKEKPSHFGGGKNIGPLLIGLGQPIEVAPLRASTSEILNLASIAAYSSDVIDYSN